MYMFEDALADADTCIALRPDKCGGHALRGRCLFALGNDQKEVIVSYTRAREIAASQGFKRTYATELKLAPRSGDFSHSSGLITDIEHTTPLYPFGRPPVHDEDDDDSDQDEADHHPERVIKRKEYQKYLMELAPASTTKEFKT